MDMKIERASQMILKTFLTFSLLIGSALSQEKNYCELNQNKVDKKVKINDFPSYFFKVHPNGKYIAYIGTGSNKLLNLETGNVIDLPGTIDPVFSPDGKYLLVPTGAEARNVHGENEAREKRNNEHTEDEDFEDSSNDSAMTYYDFEKFIELESNPNATDEMKHEIFANPVYVDEESYGVYQSASKPSGDNNQMKVITDEGGVSYRELNAGNLSESTALVTPCQNLDNFPTDLPMLSKDGSYIAVFNSETQSTQIYNIEDSNNCNLSMDLGIATGKVAFNYDSSQITFHVDHFSKNFGEYFSGVPSDINKDVYVMNLSESSNNGKKELSPTSWAKVTNNSVGGNGAYYPNFDSEGNVYYLNDQDNYFEFNKVKISDLSFKEYSPFPNIQLKSDVDGVEASECYVLEKPIQDQVVLGQMWSKICKEMTPSYQDSLLMSMGLNEKNCKEMVLANWNQAMASEIANTLQSKVDVSEILNYSMDDLLAACPSNEHSPDDAKVIGEWVERDHRDFKDIITQKCMACHTAPMTITKDVVVREYFDENENLVKEDKVKKTETLPAFDPDNIDAKTIMRMLMAVGNEDPLKRMPPGGSLREEELQAFMGYFQEQTFGMASDEDIFADVYDYNLSGYLYSEEALNQEYENQISANQEYYDSFSDELKAELLAKEKQRIWCQYGQKDCAAYITRYEQELKSYYQDEDGNLSEENKEKLARDVKLQKCSVVFDITYAECEVLWEESY